MQHRVGQPVRAAGRHLLHEDVDRVEGALAAMPGLQVVLHDHVVDHARAEEKPGGGAQAHQKAHEQQHAELRRIVDAERENYYEGDRKEEHGCHVGLPLPDLLHHELNGEEP